MSVLDDIRALGFRAFELGPLGYLPENPPELQQQLSARRLVSVGTWLVLPLAAGPLTTEQRQTAERTIEFVKASGGKHLILIDALHDDYPNSWTHRPTQAWESITGNLARLVQASGEAGLDAVVHPHAGTLIEREDQIDRLMAETQGWALGLCLDSGHCTYSGVSVDAMMSRHGDRVRLAHLKDVDGDVLAASRQQGLPFWTAVARGVFCSIGSGIVDFVAFLAAMVAAESVQYATIEQDRRPSSQAAAVLDVRASLEALSSAHELCVASS
jgi:inosose dehydratase